MSKLEFCQSCHAAAGDEELCQQCFAPLAQTRQLFTHSHPAPILLAPRARNLVEGKRLPLDLRKVEYSAPSWFARIRTRSRGAVASLIVGTFFLVSAAYFWSGHNRKLVDEQYLKARLAIEKGDFAKALICYQTSLVLHQKIFDSQGQVRDLLEQSRCLSEQGQQDEALVRLQRAANIENTPDVSLAIAGIHRHLGLESLAEAKAELQSSAYEKARILAAKAVDQLVKGGAAPGQVASAYRVSALTLAHLGDEAQAEKLVKRARKLEGDSRANRQVEAKLKSLAAQQRKQRELALRRSKAEEAAALAKSRARKLAAAATRKPAQPASSAYWTGYGNPSYGDSSYSGYSSPRVASHRLPTPDYPTYQPPQTTYEPSTTYNSQPVSPNYPPTYVPSRLPPPTTVPSVPVPGLRF